MSDNLDKLIEKLKAAKEELNKNINESYSPTPNTPSGASSMMQNEVAKKQGDIGDGRTVDGPKATPKQSDKMMRATTEKAEECHPDDPSHEGKEKKIAKDIKSKADKLSAMHKGESCTIAKNGQWKMKGSY